SHARMKYLAIVVPPAGHGALARASAGLTTPIIAGEERRLLRTESAEDAARSLGDRGRQRLKARVIAIRITKLASPPGQPSEASLRDIADHVEHYTLTDSQLLAQLDPFGAPDLVWVLSAADPQRELAIETLVFSRGHQVVERRELHAII